MEKYKLPNGFDTDDLSTYTKAWQDLARPLERVTGYKLYKFYPGLTFVNDQKTIFAHVSVDFIEKLNEALG